MDINNLWVNCSSTTAVLALIVIVVATYLLSTHILCGIRSPGPWGIPILGFYPFLREDYHVHLTELAKKHGELYLFTLCGKSYLHLSSFKAAREVFLNKSDCFLGRCQDFSLLMCVFKDGVIFTNDEEWKTQRKFLIQSMREMGLGAKEQLKEPLMNALKATLNALETSKCQPVDIANLLSMQCTEVVRQLILGDEVTSDTAQKLNSAYLTGLLPLSGVGFLIAGNVARYLVAHRIKGFNEMYDGKKEMDIMLNAILNDHKAKFDPNNPRDLIDIYLREKKAREDKCDPQARYFTDNGFLATLIQVYGDGGLTIGAIISSYLITLAEKPEIQDLIYDEIVREIGAERLPTYEDRVRLPLICSVVKELERTCTLVPAAPSLESNCDTTVMGVFVPKGTISVINFHAIHNDPVVYENPENFNPERFLPDEKTKRPKEDLPMLFGVGKRACAGESLVMTEIFMFLTAIMQHFTLTLPDPEKTKNLKKANEFQGTFQCQIVASPRKGSLFRKNSTG